MTRWYRNAIGMFKKRFKIKIKYFFYFGQTGMILTQIMLYVLLSLLKKKLNVHGTVSIW